MHNTPRPSWRAAPRRLRRLLAAAVAVTAAAVIGFAILPGSAALADGTGTMLYTPTAANEANAYARVIQLQHAGAGNGTLLATFEHWHTDGTPSQYIIRSSTDNGATWSDLSTVPDSLTGAGHPVSQMWQPFLFEYPQQLGAYPAGTLMLLGNTVPANGSYTQFQEWLSFDHGKTWKSMGAIQSGGTFGDGIWEPSLHLDTQGQLVMEFSDERDNAAHSQLLAQMVSSDGGNTWSASQPVVASSVQADRPGMATVARLGTGSYVMSYEVCGRPNCEIHLKYSSDGLHWGNPADLGPRVQTPDGLYPGHSPYITWVPNGTPDGELVLAAQQVYDTNSNAPAQVTYRAMFVNTTGGTGTWNWAPSPSPVSAASSACNADYSPDLLPEPDGTIRYTAPTSVPGQSACGEATAVADAPTLPYHSEFGTTGANGWDMFGGTWSAGGGVLSETAGGTGGNKAVAGSSGWRDYQLTAQVEATSAGSVDGVAVRVSDPSNGTDSYNGYLVFFDSHAGDFVIARENYSYEPLATVPVPGGVASGTWYQVTVRVTGSHVDATLSPAGGGTALAHAAVTDPYNSFPDGMIALRDFAGTASWRNVAVTALP